MQKYHNKLDTVRNGKVIFPAGDYYLASEVDAALDKARKEVPRDYLLKTAQTVKKLREQIVKLKDERNGYLVALEDILRLTPPCYTWTSHDEKMRVIAVRTNLFGDKDKLIRRQKNAIGYNIYRAMQRAQKSCPFPCI